MTPLLEAAALRRSFGGLTAVNDVSFSVSEGEIFGLIGPNGAGKTTLFNLITGITPVSGGAFLFNGEKLTGLPPHRIARKGLSRTFQNIRLFKEMSAMDNIKAGMHGCTRSGLLGAVMRAPGARSEERRIESRAVELLEMLGLAERRDEPAGVLSYGEQRRLEIGRALAPGPKVLLLDEPAAGMNAKEKQALIAFIRDVRSRFDLTILLIEHHVPLVMDLCDRVAVLNFGELIALGAPGEVQNDPTVIDAYLGRD